VACVASIAVCESAGVRCEQRVYVNFWAKNCRVRAVRVTGSIGWTQPYSTMAGPANSGPNETFEKLTQ